MREQEPITQTMKATEVRAQWSRLLNSVFRGNTRVIVEKSGVPVAAIVSTQDLARWQRLEAERDRRFRALDESQAAFRDLPDEEIEREVARALAEVREENRRRGKRPTGVK
ncbi:MAG: type II toxin-antitoxin system prevent-host-death family antitoxin [Dehalococcoidia bacterium]